MRNTAPNAKTRDSGARTATKLFDLKLKKEVPFYSKAALREVNAAEFIPYACHYDEDTILTKSGDLLQILKIDGLPFETADPEWLLFQKNLRNTILRTITKSRYAVYVHTIRRRQHIYPEGEFPRGFANDLNRAWKSKHSKLDLYVNDFYLTLIQRARPGGIVGLRDRFNSLFKKLDKNGQEAELKLAHKELQSVTQRFLANLKEYGVRLLRTEKTSAGFFSEPARFFSNLINLEDRPVLVPSMDMARYLPSKRIFFGKDALEVRGATSSHLAALLSI